jgi:hypothetical protein
MLLCMLCALCITAPASASRTLIQELDADRIALLNAGTIFNLVKFTEWPGDRFDDDQSPIVIGFLGSDPRLFAYLDSVVRGQRAHGRAIVLRQIGFPPARPRMTRPDPQAMQEFFTRLRATHVLIIARTEQERLHTVLSGLDDADVLTVSDMPRFAELGGMIGLTVRERRIAFDANPGEIRRTNVAVAARVLQLARVVETNEPPERTADAKAHLIVELVRLTHWPQEAFEDARSPIVIGFLGRDAMVRVLGARVNAANVQGRQVRLQQLHFPPQEERAEPGALNEFAAKLREMHMLVIAARTEQERFQRVLAFVQDSDVLTVSDIPAFTEQGGMIGITVQPNRVAVEVNSEAIEQTRLSISPRASDLWRPVARYR